MVEDFARALATDRAPGATLAVAIKIGSGRPCASITPTEETTGVLGAMRPVSSRVDSWSNKRDTIARGVSFRQRHRPGRYAG